MWCCGTDIKKDKYNRKSVFDTKQLQSLRRKFNYVSGNQPFITRQTFKKNIGFLGIRAVSTFLDRIFNSFDIDEDNKISQNDFIQYMEILKDGNDDKKAYISFNLIYMDQTKINQPQRKRKVSFSKASQMKQQNKQKPKLINLQMFQKFFLDFYKSWSNITNQSIPKQTKISLKKFISELFKKVYADGKTSIDLQYYKMLYKDRQFMMAFRQINSRLGNFFIKQDKNDSQKNVTMIHKILKKVNKLYQTSFPIMNQSFLLQIKDSKIISNHNQSNINQTKQTIIEQQLNNYYFDAKRYEATNLFESFKKDENSSKIIDHQEQSKQKKSVYLNRLEQHVIFLQKKLLFIEECLKQIIQSSKQMYDQVHQQFLKILQRIQKQQLIKKQENQKYQFEQKKNNQQTNLLKFSQQIKKKKQNKKVFFGDKNFNLVLEIMVGIQMSVRSVSGFQQIIFEQPQDFNLKHTFQMDNGHFGQSDDIYTFTDYAPNVFNHIRKIYDIQNQDYIDSIGPNKTMSALILGKMASFQQLMSQGKSGSFFYHTQDGKYLIKTISQKQFYFMRKVLQKYFRHIKSHSQTLMPRFFGLHKITSRTKKQLNSNKSVYYLVVMNNFFNINDSTNQRIVQKYDLKGSWVGRKTNQSGGVKKDLNFKEDKRMINISRQSKWKIYNIIEKDAQFFAQNNIIDYSLLIGIVQSSPKKQLNLKSYNSFRHIQPPQHSQDIQKEQKSMNFKFKGQSRSSQSYLLGIIDIFTQYTSYKQAENFFKGCVYDKKGISAVPPIQYKNRFLIFLKDEVFRIDNQIKLLSKSKSKQKSPSKKRQEQIFIFSPKTKNYKYRNSENGRYKNQELKR